MSEEIPWMNKDITPILIKALNIAKVDDPENEKKFKELLKITQFAGRISQSEVKNAMEYIKEKETLP